MGDIPRDDKDWTFTITSACPECGTDAASLDRTELAAAIRAHIGPWQAALAAPTARDRPDPRVWSPVEYACHVRDVCRLFGERARLMLENDVPVFPDWDGDAAAAAYGVSDPAVVAGELSAALEGYAATHEGLSATDGQRAGLRGDGRRFTVDALARYGLHEVAHHLWDVRDAR